MKAFLFLSASTLAAGALASAAGAQTVPASAAGAPATGPAAQGEPEIVVTAQRHEERLKDVPISVTAVTGAALERAGISSTEDLTAVTPGLNFAATGNYAQPNIRGIGTSISQPGGDANIAIYVDGIYQASQGANVFDLSNVSSVEVLKGPQGTLFGRNSTGGAIKIQTLDPSFAAAGNLNAHYGRYNEVDVSGYATGPLAPTLAANLAVEYRHSEGFLTNVTTGNKVAGHDNLSIRSKLLWKPDPALRVLVAGWYFDSNDDASYSGRFVPGTALAQKFGVTPATDPGQVSMNIDPVNTVKTYGASGTVTYDLDAFTINSITAYNHAANNIFIDFDYSAIDIGNGKFPNLDKTFTQEINLTSRSHGPLSWIAGAFYYHDNSFDDFAINLGGAPLAPYHATVVTEAISGFGELTFAVTDRLKLIGGLRYSHEKKSAFGSYNYQAEKSWGNLSERASAIYAITPQSNVYATFSTGFKSGIFNATAFNPTPTRPEKVTAYEVGYKQSAHGLYFSASAYYYDYKDIQVQTLLGDGTGVITNAASAHLYGGEAELRLPVTPEFSIGSGIAYTHADYGNFLTATLTELATGGGATQHTGDASGKRIPRTPEVTGNVSARYIAQTSYGRLEASAIASYHGSMYWDVANAFKEKAYVLLNSQIDFTLPGNHLTIGIWGKNLLDELYRSDGETTPFGFYGPRGRPRTFGVSAGFKF